MFHQPMLRVAVLTVLAQSAVGQSVQALGGGCPGAVGPTVSGPMTIGTHVQFDNLGTCTAYSLGCHAVGCDGDGYLLLGLPGPTLPLLLQGPGAVPWSCPAPFSPSVLVIVPAFDAAMLPIAIQVPIPNVASVVGFTFAAAGFCTRLSQGILPTQVLTPAIAVTIG